MLTLNCLDNFFVRFQQTRLYTQRRRWMNYYQYSVSASGECHKICLLFVWICCHITLLVPQTGPPIIKFRKRMPFIIGEKLFALCNTTRAFPAPHITWLINGKKVSGKFAKRFLLAVHLRDLDFAYYMRDTLA